MLDTVIFRMTTKRRQAYFAQLTRHNENTSNKRYRLFYAKINQSWRAQDIAKGGIL